MRSCDSYRARITAIFATAINHPIRSPASSANPHNHAPHGVSRHHGDSGPVILCTRESPHAFPHAHSHAHSHTTCTVRHAPSTTARAKLHTVPHGSVTAQPTNKHTHARASFLSARRFSALWHAWHAWHAWHTWHAWQRCTDGMHGMNGMDGMDGMDDMDGTHGMARMACMA